jgi:hypothetical protein
MATSLNSSTTGTSQHEEPTASAHLTISLCKIEAGVSVPGRQAHHVIQVFASLTGLAIMAVIGPAITLTQGRHILPTGWIVLFLLIEIAAGATLAALPYKARP